MTLEICHKHNRQLSHNGDCQDCGGKPILEETKPIKIHWVTPNGKHYEETIQMTLLQYKMFVDNLLNLKKTTTQGKCLP